MKKISTVLSVFIVLGMILSTAINRQVNAAVPGNNTLVSVNASGTGVGGMGGNTFNHVSSDGNIVFWNSDSHDVVAGDTSTGTVIYKKNLSTNTTTIVSVGTSGVVAVDEQFASSSTGRYVAFSSKASGVVLSPTVSTTNRGHVYLRDTLLNTTSLISQNELGTIANIGIDAFAYPLTVSDDGRFVGFQASVTNLLASGNPTTSTILYYLKDTLTNKVISPVKSNSGVLTNATPNTLQSSCDGSIIVFYAAATNLTPQDNGKYNIYLVDLRSGYDIKNITPSVPNVEAWSASISCNGRYVTFYSKNAGITTDTVTGTNSHMYLYDRINGGYELVDKSTSGYISTTANAGHVRFARNVSDNGKVVFFGFDANLVTPSSTLPLNVYIREPKSGTTKVVPIDSSGIERGLANTTTQATHGLEISAEGNAVVYNSFSPSLVPGIGAVSGKKLVLSKIED